MNKPEKNVTVAVINYNGENDLGGTLDAVKALDGGLISEIIVIDNHSDDKSLEFLKNNFSDIKVVALPENRGPNPARNYALEHAQTELLLIMDNDIVMEPDALSLMADALAAAPRAGAVSAQIRFFDNPEIIQYNGCHIHYAGEAIVNRSAADVPLETGSLSAGCVLVDRQKALSTGRFDEEFFFGWEDGDFFYRMRIAGFSCLVHPGAKVYHKKEKRGMRRVALQVRNRWWFMIKNYTARTFILALPMILLYQLAVFCFMILKGKGLEYLRGTLQVFSGLKGILKKKRQVTAHRVMRDRQLLTGYRFEIISDERSSAAVRAANAVLRSLFAGYWFLFSWMMG